MSVTMSVSDFNTFHNYKAPHEDHSYHIKHGTKMGDGQRNETSKHSYIGQIITRAKSSVDPRKYTPQIDWQKNSK